VRRAIAAALAVTAPENVASPTSLRE